MENVRVGIARCNVPEYAKTTTKTKGEQINAKLKELAAMGRDTPHRRNALLADALAGKVSGVDFIKRWDDLNQKDLQTIVDVETVPLFAAKQALAGEIKEAALAEATRLDGVAAERRAKLEKSLADFQGRPAAKEALLRADGGIQTAKREAIAARQFGQEFVTKEDHAWWRGFQMRLRVSLGLPATEST